MYVITRESGVANTNHKIGVVESYGYQIYASVSFEERVRIYCDV